jgi:hypothetical protein
MVAYSKASQIGLDKSASRHVAFSFAQTHTHGGATLRRARARNCARTSASAPDAHAPACARVPAKPKLAGHFITAAPGVQTQLKRAHAGRGGRWGTFEALV